MPIQSILQSRCEELKRRVNALAEEIEAWQARSIHALDMQIHYSQIKAISVLMEEFTARQQTILNKLDPESDSEIFRIHALSLVQESILAQKVWDFFRSKLELRFSPTYKDVLWLADTVAFDCYHSALEKAADEKILPRSQFREPPLTYLIAGFSPITWVRGSRPNDGRIYELGVATLPIPAIALPWDHVENIWELLTIHHEVGHDLEADFKLRPALQASTERTLANAGRQPAQIEVWLKWQGEVFADLVALQLAGPAFAEVLANLLLLPRSSVVEYNSSDPHPTPYVRILIDTAYAHTLAPECQQIKTHATNIESGWKELYGEQPQFQVYLDECKLVFQALMDSPLEPLQGKTMRSLLPFTPGDALRIASAATYLLTGQNRPSYLTPRHCVSAARLAATQASLQSDHLSEVFQAINDRTRSLIRECAPTGLRASDDSSPHRRFIASFVDRISNID
ncbi:hypothetical protein [Thermoleptolyngbya sp. M55_K2018_002]|jgi:hypothetical protein|uniref:hypothetical protein n=1 Tax=Thermoleptolyngbya sp. M55_K2018_002 TaxID=2747808 RepID=UPI0019DD85A8|nr:hypothetical protein [Thermoleptolyngbya sp. M55_K2018_002]HIK39071.1 hypothetical protein [Thermoleptolyngbya sp. M55_K2018_002]